MEVKNYFATDTQGNVLGSAQVYLYLAGTTTLATGLQNISGAALGNPFTSDANGLVQFKAPDNDYDLRVVKPGREFTIRIQCFDGVAFLHDIDGKFVASNISYDGESVEDALNLSRPIIDYAALRAYSGSALVVHITAPGIEGFFRRSGSGPDNGTTTIVDLLGRAWQRIFAGAVNVRWAEAKGDGLVDDTDAVQRALDSGLVVAFPPGTYRISRVNLRTGHTLIGMGDQSILQHFGITAPNTNMIQATDKTGISFRDLYLDGSNISGENSSFLTEFLRCSQITLTRVTFYMSSSASVKFQGNATYFCTDIRIIDCKSINPGRITSFNRNGFDFFRCRNVTVIGSYIFGSPGLTPNNVGLILMGCHYAVVESCFFDDNCDEQFQVIATSFSSVLPIDSDLRTRHVKLIGCTFKHSSNGSKTTNISIGENANDIAIIGCDMSGSLSSGIAIFKGSFDVSIEGGCSFHDSSSSAVTVTDGSLGDIRIEGCTVDNIGGSSAFIVFSDTQPAPNIVIQNNTIKRIGVGSSSTVVRPFELRGSMLGGIHINENICAGTYTHALDMTGGIVLAGKAISFNNNDVRGYTVNALRNVDRGKLFAIGNIEPDIEAPQIYRRATPITITQGGAQDITLLATESSGRLIHRPCMASGSTGVVRIAEGRTSSPTLTKRIRVTEDGVGPVTGILYTMASQT